MTYHLVNLVDRVFHILSEHYIDVNLECFRNFNVNWFVEMLHVMQKN